MLRAMRRCDVLPPATALKEISAPLKPYVTAVLLVCTCRHSKTRDADLLLAGSTAASRAQRVVDGLVGIFEARTMQQHHDVSQCARV